MECNEPLEKEAIGCMECGTPVSNKNTSGRPQQFNTISITETPTERNIQASFSDAVGKDLTGILRDAMSNKQSGTFGGQHSLPEVNRIEDTEYQEVKATSYDDEQQPKSSIVSEAPFSEAIAPLNEAQYPSLMTIAMRRLPATETEWVVLYGFFASKFGKEMFTRQQLVGLYDETRRKAPDKTNALSGNIKAAVQSGKFNAFADGNYSILEAGIELAKEIMTRTKASPPSGRSRQSKEEKGDSEDTTVSVGKSKKGAKSADKSKRLGDIDFYPTGKDSLKVYYAKFDAKSDFEKVLVFVSYFADVSKTEGVTYDHIYSCFDELGLKIPINVPQTVRNLASTKKWVNTTDSKNIVITTAGKNKLRHWDND